MSAAHMLCILCGCVGVLSFVGEVDLIRRFTRVVSCVWLRVAERERVVQESGQADCRIERGRAHQRVLLHSLTVCRRRARL